MDYYNKQKNITNQQGFPQVLMTDLQQLPIKIGSNEQMASIEQAVHRIIEDTQLSSNNKLDIIVYHLYNLTYDDVRIVDPDTSITREEYDNYKAD